MNRFWKRALTALYTLGAVIVAALSVIYILHIPGPAGEDNGCMLAFALWESAFLLLAIGAAPMLAACAGFYHAHNIRGTAHPKRNAFLVFLPGLICSVCLLVCIGILIAAMLLFAFHLAAYGS